MHITQVGVLSFGCAMHITHPGVSSLCCVCITHPGLKTVVCVTCTLKTPNSIKHTQIWAEIYAYACQLHWWLRKKN